MAKVTNGGTKFWCYKCNADTLCAAIPLERESSSERAQQKMIEAGGAQIHYFERDRRCSACGEVFATAEVDKDVLYELVRLHDRLKRVRDQAGALIRSLG